MDKLEKLRWALDRAVLAATLFANCDDGGTCNFDAPAFNFEAYGISKADAMRIIDEAGLYSYEWDMFPSKPGRGKRKHIQLVIVGFTSGQGNRRTKMAEAFCKQMQEDGCNCGMYYQMD